jgi:hypothetical protein
MLVKIPTAIVVMPANTARTATSARPPALPRPPRFTTAIIAEGDITAGRTAVDRIAAAPKSRWAGSPMRNKSLRPAGGAFVSLPLGSGR